MVDYYKKVHFTAMRQCYQRHGTDVSDASSNVLNRNVLKRSQYFLDALYRPGSNGSLFSQRFPQFPTYDDLGLSVRATP